MRMIDADELKIDYGFTWDDITPTHDEMCALIDRQPTIEPKKGKWINDDDDWCYPECSVCGKNALEVQECGFKSNYCPHCGARMENSHENN